ncbi:class I SAM-dependent methyltransferase [uncultured Aquimarina sp.]|uniref:class I SAM-dependent methyltransferase n=1 Tax=uncultured Aquimarina sp. TaxID=575652 RepID=UPI00261FD846|nr:class I SAM-dependent methyltransferase [uncultured Aquimarina sp.]
MSRYKTTFETWNKIASIYEEVFMDLDLYNDTYALFCKELIKENPSILELGCGPGNITKQILSKRPDSKILGIDIAPNMIALAKKNNPSASFKVMDGRNIGTLKSTFDGIITGFYIPYLSKSDCFSFIKDCIRLLNNQGILYISFVEGDYDDSGYQTGSTGDQIYFYYHDLDFLKKQLVEHQFSIINTLHKQYPKKDGTVDTHTIIIAKLSIR